MSFIDEYKKHWRYRYVKKLWAQGRYLKAAESFFNGLPQFFFPFAHKETGTPAGTMSYERHANDCKAAFGSRGPNSIRCWRVYFSRQIIGHAFGGVLLSIPVALPLFFLLDFYLWMWFAPLAVGAGYIVKESFDYSEEKAKVEKEYGVGIAEFKHWTDVCFWMIGASILPLILTFIKGVRF